MVLESAHENEDNSMCPHQGLSHCRNSYSARLVAHKNTRIRTLVHCMHIRVLIRLFDSELILNCIFFSPGANQVRSGTQVTKVFNN